MYFPEALPRTLRVESRAAWFPRLCSVLRLNLAVPPQVTMETWALGVGSLFSKRGASFHSRTEGSTGHVTFFISVVFAF